MAFEHESGIDGAYNRLPQKPGHSRVVFREDTFAQGADVNEGFAIQENRGRRVSNLISRDGDRIIGAEIISLETSGSYQLTAGEVYIQGDVRSVEAAILEAVPVSGNSIIGIRLLSENVTEIEDPDLKGLHAGTEAEGEAAAARVKETLAWGYAGDDGEGKLYPVYNLQDGVVIDQSPPPGLSGAEALLAEYDDDANGDYIVSGCRVSALGLVGGNQNFAIEAGIANINGRKRERFSSLRHTQVEEPDVDTIDGESHAYVGSGAHEFTVNQTPISVINSILVEKEKTVTLTKGVTNSIDNLPDSSVVEIVSVVQGGTTYVETTDYTLSADRVDWTPAGDEPGNGSSYDVTYRYRDSVAADSNTETTITVSGGFDGGEIIVNYDYKMPRVDLLCLDVNGNSVYLKGISRKGTAYPPVTPSDVLKLAEVHMHWVSSTAPRIVNNGTPAYQFDKIDRMYNRLIDGLNLLGLERLNRDIDSREPVAKKGVFVDPATSDRYRDEGESQDMALFNGSMQIAVDPTFYVMGMTGPIILNHTDQSVIEQLLNTSCRIVNPYQNFDPLPGRISLTPAIDFWTEFQTNWLSDITRRITGNTNRTTVDEVLVAEEEILIEHLRQIDVDFTIEGFGDGEIVESLTFDGLDILPSGTPTADSAGNFSGTFTIPAQVTAGTKPIVATGAGGTKAENVFVGQGIINVETLQRIITVRVRPNPPVTNQNNPIVGQGSGNNGNSPDPVAQTIILEEGRHITGLDVQFCKIGDPENDCFLQLVEVRDGTPTTNVIADTLVDMASVVAGDWTEIRFDFPVFVPVGQEYAYVLGTDDAEHSISTAVVGDFDAEIQQFVASQPYTVGVLASSSNARSWTFHQNEDMTMKVKAALFNPTTKSETLGTFAVVDASDLMMRGVWQIPTSDARGYFEMELDDGTIFQVNAFENVELDYFYTGDVIVRAILEGTSGISPVLFPGVMLVAGKMRATGTYVSKAFNMGANVRVSTYLKLWNPTGSSVAVSLDAADDNFVSVAETSREALNDGWFATEFTDADHTAQPQGRLKIVLTGTPDARPAIADLRSVSI